MKRLCLGITFFCLLVPVVLQQQGRISHVTVYQPWSEPVEVCYIIPMDGKKIIKITSNLEKRIYYIPSIPGILAKHGYEIKDIQVWIHNHLQPSEFSGEDITVYWYLRAHGFTGIYMLRTPRGIFYFAPEEK